METSTAKRSWKLTPKAKARALDLCRQGMTVKAVATQLSIELGTLVTPQAIWQFRSRNADKLRITVQEELDQAVALQPIARLDVRLLELEKVVSLALEGRDWVVEQLSKDDHTPEDRQLLLQSLVRLSSDLPLVVQAIQTAGTMVHQSRSLELALRRQAVKRDGFDRSEVEQAILRVQARGSRRPNKQSASA